MRGGDQIVVLDQQVVNRRDRQIQLQGLPAGAIIEGDVDARFRARV